jgi:hypothetical protein
MQQLALRARASKALPVSLLVIVPVLIGLLAFMVLPRNTAPVKPTVGVCQLQVPAHKLTAKGLASVYVLSGPGCSESNPNTAAFVEATIIDPATGQLYVYHPLVVDAAHMLPAAPPVLPKLPANAVVGIWFGFNGTTLTLTTHTAGCVSGFGQVSFCNAPAFYAAAQDAIAKGLLKIPALGTAKDGLVCPTTRDYSIVDQDPSDNVTGTELASPNGSLAQNSVANRKSFPTAQVMANGSDNALLSLHVDPALGCKPWTAPLLEDPGVTGPSQAMDELQAAMYQAGPVATVPINDEMVSHSLTKLNAYRAGVDQTAYISLSEANAMQLNYCTQLATTGAHRLQLDMKFTAVAPTIDPAVGTNLYTFLAARYLATWNLLHCGALLHRITPPVHVVVNAAGVATAATYN